MACELQTLESWFQQPPGARLLELETQTLAQHFTQGTVRYCLQIGGPRCLQSSCCTQKMTRLFYLNLPCTDKVTHPACLPIDPAALPIRSNSTNAVILAHLLEFTPHPQQLLSEVYRLLMPSGQVALFTFNAWSLWGIQRLWHNRGSCFPWSGQFYARRTIEHILREVGYRIITTQTLFWGAVSFIVAEKEIIGMTPLTLAAIKERERVTLGRGYAEPSTRNSNK